MAHSTYHTKNECNPSPRTIVHVPRMAPDRCLGAAAGVRQTAFFCGLKLCGPVGGHLEYVEYGFTPSRKGIGPCRPIRSRSCGVTIYRHIPNDGK